MTPAIVTFVWTDGLGTFQPRCAYCGWHGRWVGDESKAALAAEEHGKEHAAKEGAA